MAGVRNINVHSVESVNITTRKLNVLGQQVNSTEYTFRIDDGSEFSVCAFHGDRGLLTVTNHKPSAEV